jgi:hypothetical protein
MPIDPILFLTSWGREFADSVADIAAASGQDGYEVYYDALGAAPDLPSLQGITNEQVMLLRDAVREVLESPAIEASHIEQAIRRTLWHLNDGKPPDPVG